MSSIHYILKFVSNIMYKVIAPENALSLLQLFCVISWSQNKKEKLLLCVAEEAVLHHVFVHKYTDQPRFSGISSSW